MNSNQNAFSIKAMEQIENTIAIMVARDGEKPTFENFIYELVDEGTFTMDDLDENTPSMCNLKRLLFTYAKAWSDAGLGPTNWEILYKKMQGSFESAYSYLAGLNNTKTNEVIVDEIIEEKEMNSLKPENKTLKYITSLFEEVDHELIRLFKGIGLLKIIICALIIAVLWVFASFLGEEYALYSILILVGLVAVVLYVVSVGDKADSKIGQVIYFILGLAGVGFSVFVIIALGWGIFDFLRDAFYWFVELFD